MKLLEMLKGRKTVEDIDAVQAENKKEESAIQASLAAIADRRDGALLEGDELAVKKLDVEAEGLRLKLDICKRQALDIAKRKSAAVEARKRDEDEALAKRARTDVLEAFIIAARQYNASTVAILASAEKMATLDAELQRINETLRANGRADLEIETPLVAIHQELVRYAKVEGFAFPISEAWQTVAKNDGIDAVPDGSWLGIPQFPKVPDIRRITIPDYCEGGVIKWEQPFRFA